ncbi:MAG: ATP-dependent RNA helicase HrpA [Verrucomicrobiota bacterium]
MDRADLKDLFGLLPNCLRQDRLRLQPALDRLQAGTGGGISSAERLRAEIRRSIELRHRRHEGLPPVSYPAQLPISARKDEIVAAIRQHQVIVIAGETGSGKTTQIPKMCLEAGCGVEGKIGCTQPRRVAALSISRRISEELKTKWGEAVGCKIRFADRSSPQTYIKLMTDGILLAETQADRDLNEYDAIVIDEAHERSLNIDFLLGHLQGLLSRRADLKLIITSATIDTEAFARAFGNAPVIEVSGRTYPVDIRYAPHDAEAEESGELTYIDAAVRAVEMVLLESNSGDVLIFMPSERDIRETQDDLQGRYGSETEVIPLYGRLSSGEQDRVFAPSAKRKLIVSTNIAETSLTIPGVRYVIDPGLARVSRYSPRTRTKRLPIEPISQSSARQRAGRSGRMENGVCIRLYAEEDFRARPRDTQPEIQRANLAEVILKMKAWRLGEMETFPFINPPQAQAVESGYRLLEELGALDSERRLTHLGRNLARLPVDPTIGRMILQSIHEHALEDILIIAAGLSIQDPRERPLDKQEAADQAHRQFLDNRSDFLTLLNIWNAYDGQFEALRTQNQMRRFCRANFLSYPRMREWVDVHRQLEEAIAGIQRLQREPGPTPPGAAARGGHSPERAGEEAERRGTAPRTKGDSSDRCRYDAVHRAILSGLLGHIAQRTERNLYRAPGNRQVMVWPGSSLFARTKSVPKRPDGRGSPATDKPGNGVQPPWLVAGEMVETSRLFARTVAEVAPEWIAELGTHLCKRSYGEPFWDARTGRVLARERVTLFGLEVQEKPVDYGRVHPQQATELFIRAALLEDEPGVRHHFLDHNRKLRDRIAVWRTHHRNHRLPNPDDALFDFYARHLDHVSSLHDLNRLMRERGQGNSDFLCASETDLTGGTAVEWDSAAFPTEVPLADQRARLDYAYAPGKDHDGITVTLPATLAHRVDPKMLDWLVPGLRAEQIEFLLKALPKSLRVPLMPIAPKVAELAAALPSDAGLDGLRRLIQQKYDVLIPSETWNRELLPLHLRPRIAITDAHARVLATGRDLKELKRGLENHETPGEQQAWVEAARHWERYDLRSWSFGSVPTQIPVTNVAESALTAFPGLQQEGPSVHLKLFRKKEDAAAASTPAFVRLAELVLQKELAWVQKDLRSLEKLKGVYAGLLETDDLLALAYANLRDHLVHAPEPILPLDAEPFQAAVQRAKQLLPTCVPEFVELIGTILKLRHELTQHRGFPSPSVTPVKAALKDPRHLAFAQPSRPRPLLAFLPTAIEQLVPKGFLSDIPYRQLSHWPRYLKALQIRADRALLNPLKDAEKAARVTPYEREFQEMRRRPDLPRKRVEEFRSLVEEFKVSVFAQELGTAQPVSPRRLDALLTEIKQHI